jgi:hypothetical protein
MLGDFFRINFPYGIRRNELGEWHAFNREYMPLGFNDQEFKDKYQQMNLPIYSKYKGMTEKKLLAIAWNDPDGIKRDEKGEINMVFLYNDGTNPKKDAKHWEEYFKKIKLLSAFEELNPAR